MRQSNLVSSCAVAIIVAIGCGGGTPQDAAATTATTETPMQLADASAGGASAATGTASVQATITFQGTAPAEKTVKMDADPACQQQHAAAVKSEDVVVNGNGTLKNVFVYVKDGLSGAYPSPTTSVALEQVGCRYRPRVFGLQVNQPLEIVNSDATLHNVNAKPAANVPFNLAQPVQGMKSVKKFAKPEIMVKFKCNVHPWMSAYGGVLAHPFFGVSDDQGTVAIAGLPAGTYTLEAWHEVYGTQTQTVSVGDGEKKTVAFSFTAQ